MPEPEPFNMPMLEEAGFIYFTKQGGTFANLVGTELCRARQAFPRPMNSAHEGYAVLLEEVNELWDEVKAKQGARDPVRLLSELVQIAAMAQRMAEDVVRGDNSQA